MDSRETGTRERGRVSCSHTSVFPQLYIATVVGTQSFWTVELWEHGADLASPYVTQYVSVVGGFLVPISRRYESVQTRRDVGRMERLGVLVA